MTKLMFRKNLRKRGGNEGGIYYRDSLMLMSYGERLTARIITNVWVIVHVASTVILILSDVGWAFWLGVLNTFYLLDRLFRYSDGDRVLPEGDGGVENLASYLSPRARRVIISAYNKSSVIGGGFFLNLARSLTEMKSIQGMLLRLEVGRGEFEAKLDLYLGKEVAAYKDSGRLLNELEQLIFSAFNAREQGQKFIDYADLFAALGSVESEELTSLFHLFDIDGNSLHRAAVFGRMRREMGPSAVGRSSALGKILHPFQRRHHVMNRAWTARPTPFLDSVSTDLTDLARVGAIGFLVGHKEEYNRLVDVLSRSAKPNALLVGDAGVGKRAIVEHLAYMMVRDHVPQELSDKRLISLDVGGLVAGADGAQVQKRIRDVFAEIYRAGNVILFVPHIHDLARTSHPGAMTAASSVLPLIVSQDFPTIGATVPREFKQFIELDSLFSEAFETVRVEEVTSEEATHILAYGALALERKHKVTVAYRAIKTSVDLAEKYFHDRPLPSSAEDLLRETISYVANKGDNVVKSDDVISVAEERVNIPIHDVKKGEAQKLLHLEEIVHKRLVGQDEAVEVVARALREYRSGLAPKGGPIGSFLFVGPTGVGKTELAKILSEIQFGSEDAMIRFDMSEYQDTESIHRLIGSPDGKTTGSLTDAVRLAPYSLVLLDEFEKAHKDILKLFLQVFDDGRLTDSLGRTVNFENTIIIATSNAEATFIVERIRSGDKMEEISEELRKRLIRHFSPELLNRFSAVVVFKSLSPQDINAIARLHLDSFALQLKESNDITLIVDEEFVTAMAELGYDEAFGARPLTRVISDKLRAPLAEKILAGEIAHGMTIGARINNNELQIYEVK